MTNLNDLKETVDKLEVLGAELRKLKGGNMKHEFYTMERVPYSGVTSYYKVNGCKSYDELRAYHEGLSAEEQKRFGILQLNGQFCLSEKEEYSG